MVLHSEDKTTIQKQKKIFELNTRTSPATVFHILHHETKAKKLSPKAQFLTLCTSLSLGELQIEHSLADFLFPGDNLPLQQPDCKYYREKFKTNSSRNHPF